MLSKERLATIAKLAAGAKAANQHCVFETNMMYGFVQGLNATLEILNAESDNHAAEIAANHRSIMASITGATQEYWAVDEIAPDENWLVK